MHITTLEYRLWIKLWIKGDKAVDKAVDKNVDNFELWITRDLSTIHPQDIGAYPQFCPQPRGCFFGVGMGIL